MTTIELIEYCSFCSILMALVLIYHALKLIYHIGLQCDQFSVHNFIVSIRELITLINYSIRPFSKFKSEVIDDERS